MPKTVPPIESPPGSSPSIRSLTRREFTSFTLAIGATLVAGGFPIAAHGRQAGSVQTQFQRLRLTDRPSQNPAFRAKALCDGGALLWVRRQDGTVTAFVVNRLGRRIYELCDGRRSLEAVCHAYAAQTGATPAAAAGFLDDLVEKGVIVRGGYLRVSADFPRPGQGGSYVHRF